MDRNRAGESGAERARAWQQRQLRRTRRLIAASGPPIMPIPLWTAPDGVDRDTGKRVIDLAMRIGVGLLASGASAAEATVTVLRVTRAYGLHSVHVDVTYNNIVVSYHRGPEADPMTVMRVVRLGTGQYDRLGQLLHVVDDIESDPPSVEDARSRIDALLNEPDSYRPAIITAATGLVGAAAAMLSGSSLALALITFVGTCVVQRVQLFLADHGVSSFFRQAAGGVIATSLALAVAVMQRQGIALAQDLSPSLIVAATIVVLLAGLSVVGSAQDAIEGYFVTAGAKAFEGMVLTLGIVAGISTVLALAGRWGVPLTLSSPWGRHGALVQVTCAVLLCLGFAISTYAAPRTALMAGAAGGIAYALYLAFIRLGESGPVAASALAAAVGGLVAHLLARRLHMPAIAVTSSSLLPLLPGRATFEGLNLVVTGRGGGAFLTGLEVLAGAAAIGLALAAGVSFGSYCARLITDRNAIDPRRK